MNTDDFWDRAADTILTTAFAVGLLFGIAVVGWQTFGWLRTDQWTSFPFANALHMINIDLSSAYEPQSWLGLGENEMKPKRGPPPNVRLSDRLGLTEVRRSFVNNTSVQCPTKQTP